MAAETVDQQLEGLGRLISETRALVEANAHLLALHNGQLERHDLRLDEQDSKIDEQNRKLASVNHNHEITIDCIQALVYLDAAIAVKVGIEPAVMRRFEAMLARATKNRPPADGPAS